MSSRNMASLLSLAIAAALAGTGCAAQSADPVTSDDGDGQALASPAETADPATTGEENTGEAKDAWWGGWGGLGGLGWGGWGGLGWGGWGGFGGFGGCGGCGGFLPLWGGFGGCGLCGGWGGGWGGGWW